MKSEKVRSNKQLRRTRTERTPGSVELENCGFRKTTGESETIDICVQYNQDRD